jgi:hypothetical protein
MEGRSKIIEENIFNLDDRIILDLLYISYANAIEQAYRIDIPEEWFANIKNKIFALEKA